MLDCCFGTLCQHFWCFMFKIFWFLPLNENSDTARSQPVRLNKNVNPRLWCRVQFGSCCLCRLPYADWTFLQCFTNLKKTILTYNHNVRETGLLSDTLDKNRFILLDPGLELRNILHLNMRRKCVKFFFFFFPHLWVWLIWSSLYKSNQVRLCDSLR